MRTRLMIIWTTGLTISFISGILKSRSLSGTATSAVNFYGGAVDDLNIDIVIKNGNIYIKSKEDRRIEVIDSNSAIEFVDDHYKEIDKSLYEEYDFDFDKVVDSEIKEKYSSIIGFLPFSGQRIQKDSKLSSDKKLLFQ